jgi:hypothetical protein
MSASAVMIDVVCGTMASGASKPTKTKRDPVM